MGQAIRYNKEHIFIRLLIICAFMMMMMAIVFSTASASSHDFPQDHYDALNYLNELRKNVGVDPIVLNSYLTESAQNHADYLNHINHLQHEQERGQKFFTGENPTDRIVFVGYEGMSKYFEEVAAGAISGRDSIDVFMYAPLHRVALLDHRVVEMGIGVAGHYVVINTGLISDKAVDKPYHYPYHNQIIDENRFIRGTETPDPFELFDIPWSIVGYGITYYGNYDGEYDFEIIEDETGRSIPYFHGFIYRTNYIFPDDIYKHNQSYTVKIFRSDQLFDEFTFTFIDPQFPDPNQLPEIPETPEDPPYNPPAKHIEALQKINELRGKLGVPPLTLNQHLSKSAENHAYYHFINNEHGTLENSDNPGYTGLLTYDRAQAVGYDGHYFMLRSSPVYHFTDVVEALDAAILYPLYRFDLLTEDVVEIGIGQYEDVIVFDTSQDQPDGRSRYYPYNGQANVEIIDLASFYSINYRERYEYPHYSGFPITYRVQEAGQYSFELVDSNGKALEIYTSDLWSLYTDVQDFIIYPDRPLNFSETYTLNVFKNNQKFEHFSFTTRAAMVGEKVHDYTDRHYSDMDYTDEDYIDEDYINQDYADQDYADQASESTELYMDSFLDYNPTQYWAESMKWAVNNKLIYGVEERDATGQSLLYLKPNSLLTEAQFLTVLYRYSDFDLGVDEAAFEWWAEPGYQFAETHNLPVYGGIDNRNIANAAISRGRVAQIFVSFLTGSSMTEQEAIAHMYNEGWANGYPDPDGSVPKTYESYRPNNTLTRAELATFLYNISDDV